MNVLLIYVDALRPDRLGCYGYPKPTSANIDRLAREGARFKHCAAVSAHTFPPVVSMLTGRNTTTHGLVTTLDYDAFANEGTHKLARTPLHAMADNGIFVSGEFVNRWGPLGFQQELNDMVAFLEEHHDRQWFYFGSPYSTHMPYNPPKEYYDLFVDENYAPDEVTRERLKIARTAMMCHPPGIVSAMEAGQPDVISLPDDAHKRSVDIIEFIPEKDKPGVDALYDGEVRVFDDWLGKQLDHLEKLGILDDTLIIIVADHGEELLERGHLGHSSCNLMGTLRDESLMVPLVMRYPNAIKPGTVVNELISQIDIMPTIFDMLALDMPQPCDGHSLMPLIRGEPADFPAEVYADLPPAGWQQLWTDHRRYRCVRTLDWKLIQLVDLETGKKTNALYNLREDPGETKNVIEREIQVAKSLILKLDAHFAEHPAR